MAAQPAGPVLTLHPLNGKNEKPMAGVQIESSAWSKGASDYRTLTTDAEGTAEWFILLIRPIWFW